MYFIVFVFNFCILICFLFLRPATPFKFQFGLQYGQFYMWQSPSCHIFFKKIHCCERLRTNSKQFSACLLAHRFAVRLARPCGARLTKCLPESVFCFQIKMQKLGPFDFLIVYFSTHCSKN